MREMIREREKGVIGVFGEYSYTGFKPVIKAEKVGLREGEGGA